MGNGLFSEFKQGFNDVVNQTPEEKEKDKQEKQKKKSEKEQKKELENLPKEVQIVLGDHEEILYVFTFWNDKMIVTDKKLIYMDLKVAKNKTFAMIAFNKITSYSLLMPTGLSAKGKLKIFTGGDTPAIQIESIFNEGMNTFCTILANNI